MCVPCNCYHTRTNNLNEIIHECYGTKECELCLCEGDRRHCDFYPHVRETAMETLLDRVAWMGGLINRKQLVKNLATRNERVPDFVWDVISKMDSVRPEK